MRPVARGAAPVGLVIREYADAREALRARLGPYCSYCEMRLDASLAIEHVRPKSVHTALELDWNNFLLACPSCNSHKGDEDVLLSDYLWPDTDNTLRAFRYREGCPLDANPELEPRLAALVDNTIGLLGLNCRPGDGLSLGQVRQASDNRWRCRLEAWRLAQRAWGRLRRNDTPDMREQIIDQARQTGFWSVWYTVFKEDAAMRDWLIQEFDGTARDCFDAQDRPVPRPGGQL
jgi:uncharacterized protein (TIGR02646 family)